MTTVEQVLADRDAMYKHNTMAGVAFWIAGPCPPEHVYETEDEDHYSDDGCPPEHSSCVLAVMFGDDHRYHVDPDDLTEIHDTDYCGGCGQIGCGW